MKLGGAALMTAAVVLLGLVPAAPAQAAPNVTVSPTVLEFGDVALGATVSIPVVITNRSTVSMTPNYAGGAPADPTNFGATQSCGGVTLAPGQSCEFTYSFKPTSAGPHTTTTTIQVGDTTGSTNYSIFLRGYGGVSLAISASNLDFGNVAVGGSALRTVDVTNRTTSTVGPLTLSGGEPSSAAFSASLTACAGRSLAPGASCQLALTFAPKTPGRVVDAADLTIVRGDGATTAYTLALTGCG